jgi:hypothetical protein
MIFHKLSVALSALDNQLTPKFCKIEAQTIYSQPFVLKPILKVKT